MKHLTCKKTFLFLAFILIQLTSLAQVAQRNYYTNYSIAGQTAESTDEDYLLLHRAYEGTGMLSEHFVQGKITGIRGAVTSWNRKWTVEVNTGSSYNTNRASILTYNEPTMLVTLKYMDTTYLAIKIKKTSSLHNFVFTGWAYDAKLALVRGALVTNIQPFTAYDQVGVAGSLGIGTGDSLGTNKLVVNGNIAARKVIVTQASTWPDFVFKDGYQLPPLGDVEKFVKQHYHLPGIPSETEIKDKGQDLAELNKALLQKTEELTLYIIDQQKQLSKQQKQIDSLIQQLKK